MSNRLRVLGIALVVIGLVLLVIFRSSTESLGGLGPGISFLSAGAVALILSSRRAKSP